MELPLRPTIRPTLAAAPANRENSLFHLWDQSGMSRDSLKITALQLEWVQLCDGTHTIAEIQELAKKQAGGVLIPIAQIEKLVSALDRALFLDSPTFREIHDGPIRPSSHLHYYEEEPGGLKGVLEELFTRPDGPGLPGDPRADESIRAALVPHMDYARGGIAYSRAFKEILERTSASLFVIIATSHYSGHRFTLTRKHFQTPLGMVETDQKWIDRLVHYYGQGLFDDELMAHGPEHSIELEIAFLQWYYAGRRPIRIVPLLVGSFHDCTMHNIPPCDQPDISRMIKAIRAVDAETTEPVCYLISGDLAHIGPKFDDPEPVHDAQLTKSRSQDHLLIEKLEQADADGYFRLIASEQNSRRICGYPPTYTFLEALRPTRGKAISYDQYVDRKSGHESVSFASVIFER